MNFHKGKSEQALRVESNLRAMYNPNRASECNNDGVIKKSNDTELVKGGEGSRGGKVIGHRLDGKPIYGSFEHEGNKGMSAGEHGQAAADHGNEYKKAKKEGRHEDAEYHRDHQSKHYWASKED